MVGSKSPKNVDSVMLNFRKNLTALRVSKGLSQEQLASKIGVSRSSISRWEKGESIPSVKDLALLVNVLGCSYDSLLSGDDVINDEVNGEIDGKKVFNFSDEELEALGDFLKRLRYRNFFVKYLFSIPAFQTLLTSINGLVTQIIGGKLVEDTYHKKLGELIDSLLGLISSLKDDEDIKKKLGA